MVIDGSIYVKVGDAGDDEMLEQTMEMRAGGGLYSVLYSEQAHTVKK